MSTLGEGIELISLSYRMKGTMACKTPLIHRIATFFFKPNHIYVKELGQVQLTEKFPRIERFLDSRNI